MRVTLSRLGTETLLALNRLMPPANKLQLSAKRDALSYVEFFEERSASSFSLFGEMDLGGKRVLDLGCGLGANLRYLASLGPRQVVALDIDARQLACARTVFDAHQARPAPDVPFVAVNAARMAFADNSFDIIVAADTLEHIDQLEPALDECARVLVPGGLLYAYFPPYYAPWGAHMINWIRVPWCQVLFSEATVLEAARRLESQAQAVNLDLPPETRLDLGTGDVIPFVSHLTVGRFQRLVERMPVWSSVQVRLFPVGWRSGYLLSRLLRPMTRLPVLCEMFTARVVAVLQKRVDF